MNRPALTSRGRGLAPDSYLSNTPKCPASQGILPSTIQYATRQADKLALSSPNDSQR